jgi:serine phosphatase RsbU (regulator of sigma subunit)
MERINRKLALNNDRLLFASLFIGLLDTGNGSFRYANAGHMRPVLIRRGENSTLLKVPRNPIAGIDPSIGYTLGETKLGRGDLLMLYTDGVTEAHDARDALFGEARLLATLNGASRGSAADAITAVREAMRLFCGTHPQADDITLLALRYLGRT